MAARRCTSCGINYPNEARFAKCPVHETNTHWQPMVNPDEHWDWKAEAIRLRIAQVEREEEVIPGVPIQPRQDEDGLYWLDRHELIRQGFQRQLRDEEVFETRVEGKLRQDDPCNCLWEVLGWRESTREYWVRPLRVPGPTAPEPGGD